MREHLGELWLAYFGALFSGVLGFMFLTRVTVLGRTLWLGILLILAFFVLFKIIDIENEE